MAFLTAQRFTIKIEFRACLVSRRLSLDENWLYLFHGPLRVVASYSRFALTSLRNHAKNEVPEEEAGLGLCSHNTGELLVPAYKKLQVTRDYTYDNNRNDLTLIHSFLRRRKNRTLLSSKSVHGAREEFRTKRNESGSKNKVSCLKKGSEMDNFVLNRVRV